MSAAILGISTATPPRSIAQGDAADHAAARCCSTPEQARLLPALYRRTRVGRRGSVLLNGNGAQPREEFFPAARSQADRGPTTDARMRRYGDEAPRLAADAARAALDAADT